MIANGNVEEIVCEMPGGQLQLAATNAADHRARQRSLGATGFWFWGKSWFHIG